MNGLLGLLVLMMPLPLILIWALLTWVFWRVGKRFLRSRFSNGPLRIALVVTFAVIWFGWSFWEAGGKKLYWDAKVRELCAVDGGVTVYETVELPAEMFDEWGVVSFYHPSQGEDALGPDYVFITESFYYEKGDLDVWRSHYKIICRSVGRLLSESVRYSRRGGDMLGPWHPSSYSCPKEMGLVEKTFVQKDKE